jgi:hypothetical protein
VFLKRGPVFNSLFLKILFFLTFSLDKNNIGCPSMHPDPDLRKVSEIQVLILDDFLGK